MCNDMRKLQNKRKSMRNKKGTLLGRIPFSKMRLTAQKLNLCNRHH